MSKRRKRKQQSFLAKMPRLGLVAVACVVGLVGLGAQVKASLAVHKHVFPRGSAVTLDAPITKTTTPTPTPTATPKPTTAPTATPKPTSHKVAYVKPVPVVKPAPNSVVSSLVPVPQNSAPSPTTSPTPTPGSGSGGSGAAATYAYTSTNWSGYLASSGTFTGVSGSWTVPHVSGNGTSTTADAAWVGIGGVTSSDLIQAGTNDTVSASGQVTVNAFYEMLPAPETPVPGMTVGVGDEMSVNIVQLASGKWQINIADVSRGENFSTTVSYSSSLSTAEWIEEDPSYASGGLVPFDNFGTINFGGGTTTENGASQTIASAGGQAIILVSRHSGKALATPSAIGADGKSFSVTGG